MSSPRHFLLLLSGARALLVLVVVQSRESGRHTNHALAPPTSELISRLADPPLSEEELIPTVTDRSRGPRTHLSATWILDRVELRGARVRVGIWQTETTLRVYKNVHQLPRIAHSLSRRHDRPLFWLAVLITIPLAGLLGVGWTAASRGPSAETGTVAAGRLDARPPISRAAVAPAR